MRRKGEDGPQRHQEVLDRCQDEGKSPNPVDKGMSWIKANAMLGMKDSDKIIADLITDGC